MLLIAACLQLPRFEERDEVQGHALADCVHRGLAAAARKQLLEVQALEHFDTVSAVATIAFRSSPAVTARTTLQQPTLASCNPNDAARRRPSDLQLRSQPCSP